MSHLTPKSLNRIRTISTWVGAAMAVAALALILATYEGLQTDLHSLLSDRAAETITMSFLLVDDSATPDPTTYDPEGLRLFRSPYASSYREEDYEPTGEIPTFTADDVAAIQALPNVKAVAWQGFEPEFGVNESLNLPVYRVPPDFFAAKNMVLAHGRLPTPSDGPDTVVIGGAAAERLFATTSPVGAVLQSSAAAIPSDAAFPPSAYNGITDPSSAPVHTYQVTITGVLAPLSAKRPFWDREYGASIFQVDATPPAEMYQLLVQPQPGQQDTMIADLRTLFEARNTAHFQLGFTPERDEYTQRILGEFQQATVRGYAGIIGLAIFLAMVTLGITSYFGVILRSRDIGVRRSLGAPRSTIRRQFLIEGLKISLIGGVVGLGIAWALRSVAGQAGATTPVFGPLTFTVVFLTIIVIGVGASLLSIQRTVRLSPSALLRERSGGQLHRRRWLWGAPGILLSLLALIITLALRDGLAVRMNDILNWTGERTVRFIPWQYRYDPLNKPAYLTIQDYDAVKMAFPNWSVVWLRDTRKTVVEASANLPQVLPIKLACGRWITPEEEQKHAHVVVLGKQQAAKAAAARNLTDPCATTKWQGLPVVGVLDTWDLQIAQGLSPLGAYVPIGSRISPTLDKPGTVWPWATMPELQGQIIVQVPPNVDLGQAATEIKAFLQARHPDGEPQMVLPAGVTEDLLDRRNQIYTLAGVMALLCLLIGGIGLLNLTFISVLSRAREIGIRRALGATKRRILGRILGEVVRLCLGAALLGAAAGLAIARVLQVRFGWPPTTPWELIALAAGLAVLVGLAAGILPAWWAANLPPTRAIKAE